MAVDNPLKSAPISDGWKYLFAHNNDGETATVYRVRVTLGPQDLWEDNNWEDFPTEEDAQEIYDQITSYEGLDEALELQGLL